MDVHSSSSSSTTAPSTGNTKADAAVGVTLVIGLPLIFIIVTAVVVLLVVLAWLFYRSRQKKVLPLHGYKAIGTEDSGSATPLPYPPAVKLGEPPVPAMSFVMATQLSDPTKAGSRYPFEFGEHKKTQPQQQQEERRPPRLRTRRKGNHKHGNGRHVILPSGDLSSDSSSADRRSVERTGGASLISGEPYIAPISPSRVTGSAEQGEESKLPEIFLQMTYREETASLTVKIEKVVSLPFREDGSPVDAYVRLFFKAKLPDLPQRRTSKTRTQRRESAPVFDEEIRYEAMSTEELINSTLHIEVLDYRSYGKHHVLGQADLALAQVQFENEEASLTLYLHPPKLRENLGTVLLSLSYSPDTKKLSVIILRAKDLNRGVAKETDAQVKIWITLGGDKVLAKHKTKKKPQSASPIFNEALTCAIEPSQMKNAAVNVSMTNESRLASKRELGQVFLCSQSSGEEFRHWNDVIATPGKHIAEWHELR